MTAYTMTQPVETRTLVAATADTATMAGGFSAVLVFNQDATAYIYVRADGTAAVSAGSGSYPVPPGVHPHRVDHLLRDPHLLDHRGAGRPVRCRVDRAGGLT
jgi:hypothetical protein